MKKLIFLLPIFLFSCVGVDSTQNNKGCVIVDKAESVCSGNILLRLRFYDAETQRYSFKSMTQKMFI